MRTVYRIGLGLLVGLSFAVGYAARLTCNAADSQRSQAARSAPLLVPGTRVASVDLQGTSVDLKPLETLVGVVSDLRQHYVEPITEADEGRMTYDAIRAMLASLGDPDTRLVESAQRKVIEDAAQGKFHGIGAILGIKRVTTGKISEEHLVVVTPVASSPAAAAGLQSGDDIVAVDGKLVLPFDPYQKANEIIKAEMNRKTERAGARKKLKAEQERIENGIPIFEAEDMLVSRDDKEVELSVARKGLTRPVKIRIKPGEFTVTAVTSSVIEDGRLGYIKVNCISRDVGEQVAAAVGEMKSSNVKGLVLDLRNLAGGEVEPVLALAKPFMPGKRLASLVQSRGRRSTIAVPEAEPNQAWSGPIVVLVNEGTARMSEVLAAALAENRGAKLVGQKTYGDFGFVTLMEQPDGSAVMLTTGKLVTSRGRDFAGKGLPVDVTVAAAGSGDAQLREAVKVMEHYE